MSRIANRPTWVILAIAATVMFSRGSTLAAKENPEWKEFRKSHPLHMQVIALSRPSVAKKRTLIVSEPPPHVTPEKVKNLGKNFVESVDVASHPLGYDGWVKDLIISVPDEQAKLNDFISRLQRFVFHTGYKAQVLDLPHREPARGKHKLDYKVSAAELSRWSEDDVGGFTPLEGGDALKRKDIFALAHSQVFFSAKARGLVAWWWNAPQIVVQVL